MEDIFKQVEELVRPIINGRIVNNPRYADDTVLLGENEQELH